MLREFSTPVKLKVSIRNCFICQMESSRGCNRELFGPLKKGISSSGRSETLLSQAVMSKQEHVGCHIFRTTQLEIKKR